MPQTHLQAIMTECLIYDAVRTPRGYAHSGGALHEVTSVELAAGVLRALRTRNRLDTAAVDDVILGVANPFGEAGSDIARIAVLKADFHQGVGGLQISRLCASGLEAVTLAAARVMAGQAGLCIGGGLESMSRVKADQSGGAWSADPSVALKTGFIPQGVSADLIATRYGCSRTDVDALALGSQQRATHAWERDFFKGTVIPVCDLNGLAICRRDEQLRPDTTMESLAALKPSFSGVGSLFGFDAVALSRYPELEALDHVHHPGNSAGHADGAAGVLLGSGETGNRLGLEARARVRSFASAGSDPCMMLAGTIPAAEKALAQARMSAADIDLFEINEVYASVVLCTERHFSLDHDRVNVNGGAIAMGHPMGATGAMMVGTALDELERRGLGTMLVAACAGMGLGSAAVFERL